MGTHISRVKSVDLDSWTDEQLQNVIKWGNARANKSVGFLLATNANIRTVDADGPQILGSKACAGPYSV